MLVKFCVPLRPIAKQAMRIGKTRDRLKVRTYQNARVIEHTRLFRLLAGPHLPSVPLSGPLSMWILFVFKHAKTRGWRTGIPDCDNLTKMVGDSMEAAPGWRGFYENDSQIVELRVAKCYGAEFAIYVGINAAPPLRESEVVKMFDPEGI